MRAFKRYWAVLTFLAGCAGMERDCSSCNAQNFGADWVVVQTDAFGHPFRCWSLRNTSISNEGHSDGIYWQEGAGNLVHIANNYNRVQVIAGDWDGAYHEVGLTQATCRMVHGTFYDPAGHYGPQDAGSIAP